MPKGPKRGVRRVYGGPWSKLAGGPPLTKELLNRVGEALVESIVDEARRDLALQGNQKTPVGIAEGLPTKGHFLDSFSHRLVGNKTIEIVSTWPFIEQITEGRKPFRMTWLTQEEGVYKVPIVQQDGTVVVRTAPLTRGDAWIHPGFARHTFLQRGVRKGRVKIGRIVMEELKLALEQGDPFR